MGEPKIKYDVVWVDLHQKTTEYLNNVLNNKAEEGWHLAFIIHGVVDADELTRCIFKKAEG